MSISTEIDTARNVVLMKIETSITVAELVAGCESIFQLSEFRPNMHVIWDLSGLRLTKIPMSDIRALPGALQTYMEQRGDSYKAVLVTRRSADYQLMRIYLSILKLIGANVNFRLHASIDAAYAWIADD